jgi:hypothetical protein
MQLQISWEIQMWITKWNKKKSWSTFFFSLQHFWGKRMCWSFGIGLTQTHKQKFNMKLIYTTKQKKQLVQIEHKWCNELNKDNLKLKLNTTCIL